MKIRKVIRTILFFIILALLIQVISETFIALDSSDVENIEGFYAEPKNSIDMVMLGPSEVYTGYAPAIAWKEYGLKSCNISIGAVPCNMYKSMVKEILRMQQPKLIVVNAAGFDHGNWNLGNEVYLRKWVDSMPFSTNKLETIEEDVPTVATNGVEDSVVESDNENNESDNIRKNISDTMYFPLEKYHGNWKDPRAVGVSFVTRTYMKLSGGGYLKGYYAKANKTGGRENLANIGQPTQEAYFLTDECRTYLEEFLAYCKNAGVEHVLMFQPPHETEAIDKSGIEQMQQITETYGYDFLDLSTEYENIVGIDDANDFSDYDHLNVYGTRKLTSYLGKLAVEKYGIHSETTGSEKSRWEKSVKKTEEVMDMCESCIDRGTLMGFGELEATDMYQWYFKNKYYK